MSTTNPTVIRSARRNRRYAIALLALALLAVASIVNALYLRTQPVAVNDLEAPAAVQALPSSPELMRARATDAYTTQLDRLRRQGTENRISPHDHSLHGPVYRIKEPVREHDHSLHGPIYTVKNRISKHDHSLHGPIYITKEPIPEHDHSLHGPIYDSQR
ncbi:MAG: hypothetical protein M3220_12315 [Chloroflexota bacterium]|nr:hypothetical protein [Chloroflexota bacterium]